MPQPQDAMSLTPVVIPPIAPSNTCGTTRTKTCYSRKRTLYLRSRPAQALLEPLASSTWLQADSLPGPLRLQCSCRFHPRHNHRLGACLCPLSQPYQPAKPPAHDTIRTSRQQQPMQPLMQPFQPSKMDPLRWLRQRMRWRHVNILPYTATQRPLLLQQRR